VPKHRLELLEAFARGLLDLVGTMVEMAGRLGATGVVRVDWSGGERNRPLGVYRFCNCLRCKERRDKIPQNFLARCDQWPSRDICYVSASDNEGNGFSIIFLNRAHARGLVAAVKRAPFKDVKVRSLGCEWDGCDRTRTASACEAEAPVDETRDSVQRELLRQREFWSSCGKEARSR
jgi:hypothetical protein